MSISKIIALMVLATTLLISSVVANSPAPAPSPHSSGRVRKIISPASSPHSHTPKQSVASPKLAPQADSPSNDTPSSISDSPSQAPAPAHSNAVSNRFTVFGGSVAVLLCAAVLSL